MIGPHYEYLTNAYVEAMGMEKWLYHDSTPYLIVFGIEYKASWWVVTYNHCLYYREADGLAWSRRP